MNDRGFTLVELMVVVLIIGILVAIAIPFYNKTVERAQRHACQAKQRTLMDALTQYRAEYGSYPDNLATNTQFKNYLKNIPTCPTNGADYAFKPGDPANLISCPTVGHNL